MVSVVKRLSTEASRINFRDIEVRIGIVDESDKGAVQLTGNALAAYFDDSDGMDEALIPLTKPTDGRYLTLQYMGTVTLEVNEVYVYF